MGQPGTTPEFERLAAAAAGHFAADRWDEAEAAYRAALAIAPGHPVILHNLGVLAARVGDHEAAIVRLDAALAADARYVSAFYHRAAALDALGRQPEAIADFGRAVALDPAHYASHRALGFLLLAAGRRGRALDHFARTYDLRRGQDRTGLAARSLDHASRMKLRHDAAQFRHLAGVGRDTAGFDALARRYDSVAAHFPAAVTALSGADLERLGQTYNTAIHLRDAPEMAEGAVARRPDRQRLVDAIAEGKSAVFVDDFLTPRAFTTLQRHLLESTIWHDFAHIGGFVASYLEDGLASPLLLQVADELRAALPELLAAHPLSQAWSFKAVAPKAAVDVHADDGAVSVNFWMTPSAANRDPGCGGMGVCLTPPPPDWRVTGYDEDKGRSEDFLDRHRGDVLLVPYRENRAVLFRSRLLHYSDRPDFADGYEHHRINVTLLFGRGSAHLA